MSIQLRVLTAAQDFKSYGVAVADQDFANRIKGKVIGAEWGAGTDGQGIMWFEIGFSDKSKIRIEDVAGGPFLLFVQPPSRP